MRDAARFCQDATNNQTPTTDHQQQTKKQTTNNQQPTTTPPRAAAGPVNFVQCGMKTGMNIMFDKVIINFNLIITSSFFRFIVVIISITTTTHHAATAAGHHDNPCKSRLTPPPPPPPPPPTLAPKAARLPQATATHHASIITLICAMAIRVKSDVIRIFKSNKNVPLSPNTVYSSQTRCQPVIPLDRTTGAKSLCRTTGNSV